MLNTVQLAMVGAGASPSAARRVHTLHPGDVVVADRGDRLETLLGSCVAIVLTDPRRTIGAMCHIVHSRSPTAGTTASGAYAATALQLIYAGLRERGITPALCEAWVFGGGNMFPAQFASRHVGADNVDWAIAALDRDGMRLLAHDVGGAAYRRLAWTVGTGAPEVQAVEV